MGKGVFALLIEAREVHDKFGALHAAYNLYSGGFIEQQRQRKREFESRRNQQLETLRDLLTELIAKLEDALPDVCAKGAFDDSKRELRDSLRPHMGQTVEYSRAILQQIGRFCAEHESELALVMVSTPAA